MARSSVLLASGGMDSLMMWRLLGQPPIIYCSVHVPYGATELGALMWPQTVDYLKVSERIDLRNLELPDGHIPFRNLALVLAAALEGYETIYLGALAGESSRDKSGRFFRDTSRLLSYCENKSVKVVAPFRHKTKTELVQTYLESADEVHQMRPRSRHDDGLLSRVSGRTSRWSSPQGESTNSSGESRETGQSYRQSVRAMREHDEDSGASRRLPRTDEDQVAVRAGSQGVSPLVTCVTSQTVTRAKLVEDLLHTRSCYTGRYPGCGQCMACFRRWVAFFLNGIGERYERPPWEWHTATSFTWRDALVGLRSVPIAEWPAVARNNRQALKALHMARNPLPMPSE